MTSVEEDEDSEHFGELRSLLQRPPGVGVWSRICQVVEAWSPRVFRSRALPYAVGHLRRWPDALRRAPQRWAQQVLRGGRAPWPWELVRVLELRMPNLPEIVDQDEPFLEGDAALEALLESGALGHVSGLGLIDLGMSDAGCAALVTRPEIERVRRLDLRGNHLGAAGVSALARAGALAGLEALDLRSNHWGGYEEAVGQLAQARHLSALRALELECDLTSSDLVKLLSSSVLERLEHLGLEGCFHQVAIEDDEFLEMDAGSLNRPIALRSLRSLSLANNLLMDAELEAILSSPWIGQLEALDLAWNDITDRGVEALVGCEALAGLGQLSLRGCTIGPQGARALARGGALREVRQLDVSSTRGVIEAPDGKALPSLLAEDAPRRYWLEALSGPGARLERLRALNLSDLNLELGAEDVARLAQSPQLRGLERLELAHAGLTAEGARAMLCEPEHLPGLVELNLNRNHDLGADLAGALEELALPSIRRLKLRECGLGDEEGQRLARAPQLARLELLDLRGNALSAPTIELLERAEALRLCHVIT